MKKSIALSTTIASWTRKLSFSFLITGLWFSPGFAETKKVEIVGSPEIYEDRVTVRIKVYGAEDKPLTGLKETDFSLFVEDKKNGKQEVQFRSNDWKSPQETTPPPAWVVILLDMSGSMREEDSQGTTKLQGAINAIETFIDLAAKREDNKTKIAIVPFGEPGTGCPGFSVDKNTLDLDNFVLAGDVKLQNKLDTLADAESILCASTDLYQPLTQAIKFLGKTKDSPSYLQEGEKGLEPRLSIILLSDGYHNKPNEKQDFETLKRLLELNDQIIVHTLGYGLTPEELQTKYGLEKPATRQDIGTGPGKVPEKQFVDRDRLAEIGRLTGGIREFSGDAKEIAKNLQLFLIALLGEYEITYTEPNPERGGRKNLEVVVESPKDDSPVASQPKSYTVTIFGRTLPGKTRFFMLLSTLAVMVLGGVVPFWFWAQELKRQAMDN